MKLNNIAHSDPISPDILKCGSNLYSNKYTILCLFQVKRSLSAFSVPLSTFGQALVNYAETEKCKSNLFL